MLASYNLATGVSENHAYYLGSEPFKWARSLSRHSGLLYMVVCFAWDILTQNAHVLLPVGRLQINVFTCDQEWGD